MAGGGEEHAAHSSAQDDAKDSESDGDAAEDILEESPCKRWSKRREQVKQRDVPGIDVAYLAMDNETVAPDAINHHVKTCRDNLKNMHYMAPEYEYCTEVTPAADIYSFGVCAVEIAVMGGLSGCQNGATDGPISRESIEKAVRSLEDEKQRDLIQLCLQKDPLKRPSARQLLFHPVLFEVHSLKLLSAHKIVDSKLFDDLPADAFRVPDMEKVAAVARRETGVREMAYCQVPAFQHDLEKIVEDVRNGIYPLTAFAPLAHQPLKSTEFSSTGRNIAGGSVLDGGDEVETSQVLARSSPASRRKLK
ncbi:hypothetical protein TELCIR_07253 [Teladorsagia circumcincta]|uniref:Protein kinase domain-containing protein n=1 Tax=Teladorsagia circumcincta TaxID=45464 RepID=A0A2G9UKW4_TELCI|nr:hypothetical protein TELCIR_07253 [Teladorsagia circumcincta]